MTYTDICCLLWYSNKGVSCSYWIDLKVIDTSIIFLFGTWYLDVAVWGVYFPWTTEITASNLYSLIMVIMIWDLYDMVLDRGG